MLICLSDLGQVIANRIKHEESVMQCKIMGFCTPLLTETAYELWLNSQKRALHLKCASYLERDAHQCKYCGEGDFITFHRYAVDGMLWKIDSRELRNEPEKDILSEAASEIVSTTLRAVGKVLHCHKSGDDVGVPLVIGCWGTQKWGRGDFDCCRKQVIWGQLLLLTCGNYTHLGLRGKLLRNCEQRRKVNPFPSFPEIAIPRGFHTQSNVAHTSLPTSKHAESLCWSTRVQSRGIVDHLLLLAGRGCCNQLGFCFYL